MKFLKKCVLHDFEIRSFIAYTLGKGQNNSSKCSVILGMQFFMVQTVRVLLSALSTNIYALLPVQCRYPE